jgi:hypothetical protein
MKTKPSEVKVKGTRFNRNFTESEKKTMLDVLAFNDYNFKKAHEILWDKGIFVGITTLKKYRKEYDYLISNVPAKHVVEWEEKVYKQQDGLLEKTFKLHDLLLDRMIELVPQEKNLHNLTTALGMLRQSNTDAKHSLGYDKTTSLITQINNYLTVKDEQKDKSPGDIQDVPFEPVK